MYSPFVSNTLAQSPSIQWWSELHGCCDSLALAESIRANARLHVVITTDMQSLLRLEHELQFFLGGHWPVLQFPDWETLPYDVFSPLPEITSQRLKTLVQLPQTERGVL
jgi:transcription-repair coupling factor (superfamily II helicase)